MVFTKLTRKEWAYTAAAAGLVSSLLVGTGYWMQNEERLSALFNREAVTEPVQPAPELHSTMIRAGFRHDAVEIQAERTGSDHAATGVTRLYHPEPEYMAKIAVPGCTAGGAPLLLSFYPAIINDPSKAALTEAHGNDAAYTRVRRLEIAHIVHDLWRTVPSDTLAAYDGDDTGHRSDLQMLLRTAAAEIYRQTGVQTSLQADPRHAVQPLPPANAPTCAPPQPGR